MPYEINKNTAICPADKPWAVTNKIDGELYGCHPTKTDAVDQMQALLINVEEGKAPVLTRRLAYRMPTSDPDEPLRFVVASEGRKDDGIDLRMDRVDLSRLTANPVVMMMHDYSRLPIGRAENIHVQDGDLLADAVFDLDDPNGTEVDRKYRNGFLNAVSVGFEARNVGDDGQPESWTPLEFSAVPIGMDPDALLTMSRSALADELASRLRTTLAAQRGAIRVHHTATVDREWDGEKAMAAAPNDKTVLTYMGAWYADDGDRDEKQTYKLPHHEPGTDTPANLHAVRNALARLSQSSIPESDRDGVKAHLQAHLDDAESRAVHRTAFGRRLHLYSA